MTDEPTGMSAPESDQGLFDPRKRTAGDYAHLTLQAVLNGALSFVPGGGAATILLSEFVASPAQKRRDAFLLQVAQDLHRLKKKIDVDAETLQQSPAFVSAVIAASAASIQTGEPEKIDALRAALVSTAQQHDFYEAYNQMLIAALRDMTSVHIRLIRFFEGRDYATVQKKGKNGVLHQHDFDVEVRPVFGETFPMYIIHRACKELEAAGLIGVPSGFASQMSGPNYVTMLLTQFGAVFAKFITLPDEQGEDKGE